MPDPVNISPADDYLAFLEQTHFNHGEIRDEAGGVDAMPYKPRPASFDFLRVDGTDFTVRGGQIRWSGRSSYAFPESTVAIVGGTAESPGCVCIRLAAADGPSSATLQFVTSKNPPDDDGTYFFKPLYEAYLVAGVAACGSDRRPDWCLGSPI